MRRFFSMLTAALLTFGVLVGVPSSTQSPGRPNNKPDVVSGGVAGAAPTKTPGSPARPVSPTPGHGPGLGKGANTLVLYDSTGPYAWLGETYATQVANLVSHFGAWTARPVVKYDAGDMSAYSAVVYVGSTYDEPLPAAFLDDVSKARIPVMWVYDNIWQLAKKLGNDAFRKAYGFTPRQYDLSLVKEVRYKGTSLTRSTLNKAGIMDYVITDHRRVRSLAQAVRSNGTTFPWAIRSGHLTYVGEDPFSFVSHDDRYIAFADMLFDILAPPTATRHRALVRLEDVGPDSDPAALRAIADYLNRRQVPFAVAVFPEYRDPRGANSKGKPTVKRLRDTPDVVAALKYVVAKGGTLIMHGYTHQYGTTTNPYNAASGDDFEFFRAHVDPKNYVRLDGPIPEDSAEWAGARIDRAYAEFEAAGLGRPTTFEFPHYAGSATDYAVVASKVGPRYDRGLYFPGVLSGGKIDYTRPLGQFFPYAVRDVYGSTVVPENLGNVELKEYNHNPPRFPADILASARRNLVVRDGVASFFFHPYLDIKYLRQIVEGMQSMGYTFVPASTVSES